MDAEFVGDGNYVGDGGAELQQLWEFAPWKMIANCPGRYTIRHSKRSPVEVDGAPVTSIDTQTLLGATFGSSSCSMKVLRLASERCHDRMQVVVFATGGGVITYCKTPTREDNSEGQTVFVHTLNTASGLKRKLRGLELAHVLETER